VSDEKRRWGLGACIGLGIGMAAALSLLAGFGISLATVQGDLPSGSTGTSFFGTVAGSYLFAGILGGLAYYPLQHYTHRYLGKVAFCFLLGLFGYGGIGLGSALAHQYLGMNIFDRPSAAEEWASLPSTTLILAAVAALIGPVVWMAKSGQTETKW